MMNPVKRGRLEAVMTDLILQQAIVRNVRLNEFADGVVGAGSKESQRANDLMNKIERELAVVINDLAEVCKSEVSEEEKKAARVVAARGQPDPV
jgi:hypothetical protein